MLPPLRKILPTHLSTATNEALYGSADHTELPKPTRQPRATRRQELKREEASLLREKDIIERRLNEITAELAALPA
jgi:hypothetical protein